MSTTNNSIDTNTTINNNLFINGYETIATTLGDLLYGNTSGVPTRLAGNTSATSQLLVQTGNGTVSAAPSWATPNTILGLPLMNNTNRSTMTATTGNAGQWFFSNDGVIATWNGSNWTSPINLFSGVYLSTIANLTTNGIITTTGNAGTLTVVPTTNFVSTGGTGYAQVAFTQTNSAGPSATTTETALTGTGTGSLTIAANRLAAGSTIRYKLSGYLATTLTPTLEIKAKLGSTVLSDTGAQTLVSITGNGLFTISGEITCRTTGASGTVIGQGMIIYYTGATGLNGIQATPSTTTTTIDTTVTQAFSVTAQFGASTGNSATCTNCTVEILN